MSNYTYFFGWPIAHNKAHQVWAFKKYKYLAEYGLMLSLKASLGLYVFLNFILACMD